MLSTKISAPYKLIQQGLAARCQHSGALGETPGFDPKRPPPGMKNVDGSKKSTDEIEERIEQGKYYAKELYSRDSYLGRPMGQEEGEAEVDNIIKKCSSKADEIVNKADKIEALAEETKGIAQKATEAFNKLKDQFMKK